ncbi:MAG: caspase family protein, partial [Acidobacteriota bacterium]
GYSGGVEPLATPTSDARALGRLLREEHGFEVTELLDADADRFGIEDLLAELRDTADGDTALLFYFAGHGVTKDQSDGAPRGFLMPYDATADASTWLAMEEVNRELDALECHHLLVVLDCCFAGSFRWATRNIVAEGEALYRSQLERFRRHPARQLLASAAHFEKAADSLGSVREDGAQDHSPFAAALLDGLRGDADAGSAGFESDGVMTATELFQYVRNRLHRDGARQTPSLGTLRNESLGEFVFNSPGVDEAPKDDPPPEEADNPWLGLKPYGAAESKRFFGRSREIEDLVARVEAEPLTVLTGPSGVGKTSLLMAGVVPALRDPDPRRQQAPWRVEVIGAPAACDPASELPAVTSAPEGPALVVVDHLERVFGYCVAPAREDFFARLVSLIEAGWKVLVAVRGGFALPLGSRLAFGERMRRASFPLEPPDLEGLRRIVEGPAARRGLGFEPPGLVARIAGGVHGMPGALPLLSFALQQIFIASVVRRRREGAGLSITEEDYDAVGGVAGALQSHAEEIYCRAEDVPGKADLIRWVFLRLVSVDGGQLARRRVSLAELERRDAAERGLVDELVHEFERKGLISRDLDAGTVEPAHDALIGAWPRLLAWVEEEDSLTLWRQLWSAAQAWRDGEDRAQKRGLLWTEDPRHALFHEDRSAWARARRHLLSRRMNRARRRRARERRESLRRGLNTLEWDFIEAARREQKRRRGVRAALGLVAALAVLFFALSTYRQLSREAELSAKNAELNRRGCAALESMLEVGALAADAEARVRSHYLSATAGALLVDGRVEQARLVVLEAGGDAAEIAVERQLHAVLAATEGHLVGPAGPLAPSEWLLELEEPPDPVEGADASGSGELTDEPGEPAEADPSAEGAWIEGPGVLGGTPLDDPQSRFIVDRFGAVVRVRDRRTDLEIVRWSAPATVDDLAWSADRRRLLVRTGGE